MRIQGVILTRRSHKKEFIMAEEPVMASALASQKLDIGKRKIAVYVTAPSNVDMVSIKVFPYEEKLGVKRFKSLGRSRLSVSANGEVSVSYSNIPLSPLEQKQTETIGLDKGRILQLGEKMKGGESLTTDEMMELSSAALKAANHVRHQMDPRGNTKNEEPRR